MVFDVLGCIRATEVKRLEQNTANAHLAEAVVGMSTLTWDAMKRMGT
jgi:hypothetical protein